MKHRLKHNGHKGKKVVAVTSGANINFERLRLVAELANVGASTEATLTTTIPERPGAFITFIDTIMRSVDPSTSPADSEGVQVTELKYRFSAGSEAQIFWGAGIRDQSELGSMINALEAAGMPTQDVSKMEAAQLHLRHLVGGRARSFTGALPSERIYQITFPEKQGALHAFLRVVSPTWNVTLFHYRKSGNRESSVLLGLQLPSADKERFSRAIEVLQGFVFKELGAEERKVFDKFIA